MAVNITGGGGGARIGAPCAVPRGYMARASHSGSCERDCGDQCSRQKFKLSHLISPLHMKANGVWLLYGNGAAIDGLKLQFPHVVQRPARSGASYDHSPSSKSSRRIELCEA